MSFLYDACAGTSPANAARVVERREYDDLARYISVGLDSILNLYNVVYDGNLRRIVADDFGLGGESGFAIICWPCAMIHVERTNSIFRAAGETQAFRHLGADRIALVHRKGDSDQDADYRNNDQELYQCKARLLFGH